jgi:hypothetical protein
MSVEICLLPFVFGQTVHSESLTIDNTGGVLGTPLSLQFSAQPVCPDVGAPPGGPVVELTSGGGDFVIGLFIDLTAEGPCPSLRPAVHVSGGVLVLAAFDLRGATGYGIRHGVETSADALILQDGSILGTHGPAVETSGYVNLKRVEIATTTVDAETGGTAVLSGLGGLDWINLVDSVLFSNMVDGTGGVGIALVASSTVTAENAAFIDNVVSADLAVVHTGTPPPPYFLGPEGLETTPHGFSEVTFARNRHVVFDGSVALDAGVPSTFTDLEGGACAAVPLQPYEDRASAFAGLGGADGPLLVLSAADASGAEFFLRRSFVVGNDCGAAPLISVSGTSQRWLTVIHSTFADNVAGRLMQVDDSNIAVVTMLRNLYLDEIPADGVLVATSGPLQGAFVSMNAAPVGALWREGDLASSATIAGPDLLAEPLELHDASDFRSLTPCDRLQALCPGAGPSTCIELVEAGRRFPCAPDAAAEWLPADALRAAISHRWPWTSTFFDPTNIERDTPGAGGSSCGWARSTRDRVLVPPDGVWGDGDSFPDALDCDNEDAAVVPGLPEHDGFSSIYCDASAVDCYQCPDGSELPPADDDDSALADDDDSALGTGDDGEGLDDDDSGSSDTDPGCGVAGCGFSWNCEAASAGAFLALLPLGLRRRRHSASSAV